MCSTEGLRLRFCDVDSDASRVVDESMEGEGRGGRLGKRENGMETDG